MKEHSSTDRHTQPAIERLEQLLRSQSVAYRIHHHDALLASAESGVAHGFGTLDQMVPTLILKAPDRFVAAIISGTTKLSYRKLRTHLGVSNLSLASAEDVKRIAGSPIGAVSLVQPGLLTLIDRRVLAQPLVFGGCGVPHYTLEISPQDLLKVTGAEVLDFAEPKG